MTPRAHGGDALADAAFAWMEARLDPHSAAPVAVALSGGGDSVALLHLTAEWARRCGRKVLALTVDHGLNPQSPLWTAAAGREAARAGATWRSLSWDGPKPASGLAGSARRARHALLAEAARGAGARVVLVGHTADDVRENAWMRAGVAPAIGLLTADWAPSPVWPEGRGVMLGRPLIGLDRAALRVWLTQRRLAWLEDPANDDPASLRALARRALAVENALPEPIAGLARGDLPALAADVAWPGSGAPFIPRASLRSADAACAAALIGILCVCVGGGEAPPRRGRAAALAERLRGEADVAATLAGALVRTDGDLVRFGREPPRRGRPAPEDRAPDDDRERVRARFAAAAGLTPTESLVGRRHDATDGMALASRKGRMAHRLRSSYLHDSSAPLGAHGHDCG